MPPFRFVGDEAASFHYASQALPVLGWLLSYILSTVVRAFVHEVEAASHIHEHAAIKIEQCQVDRASPAMARSSCNVAMLDHLILVDIRVVHIRGIW